VKTRGPASTPGLILHPRAVSFQTGEAVQGAKTCGLLGIRVQAVVHAAVNKTGTWSWGRKELAPQKSWFPTTSPLRKPLILHEPPFLTRFELAPLSQPSSNYLRPWGARRAGF
jgi:hypothetical protein